MQFLSLFFFSLIVVVAVAQNGNAPLYEGRPYRLWEQDIHVQCKYWCEGADKCRERFPNGRLDCMEQCLESRVYNPKSIKKHLQEFIGSLGSCINWEAYH